MKKKKGGILRHLIPMAIGAVIGVIMGLLAVSSDVHILWTLLIFFISVYLHFIIHEGGHLLFGLLSGYRFVSFRIGSVMLSKQKGKLKLSRYTVAGTGGQCLLAPPEGEAENAPFMLYHFGGVIMNVVVGLLSLLLAPLGGIGKIIGISMASSGLLLALMNGIPLRTNMVANDGKNALMMKKSPAMRVAVANQLRINAGLAENMRLREMPLAWFETSEETHGFNGVFAFQRLMDEEEYAKARAYGEAYLKRDDLIGLYRGLVQSDLLTLKLLDGEKAEKTAEITRIQAAMKSNPSVLRAQYVEALLLDGDENAADKIMKKFDHMAKTYPYPCELMPERTLMARALDVYKTKEDKNNG